MASPCARSAVAEGIPAPQHCQPREAAEPPLHPAAPAPPVPGAMGRAGPPRGSAPSAHSGSPRRPSSPPRKGRAGRAPGALLGRPPSGRDLPAVAHPWNAPHPEGGRQQQPLSHVPAARMPLPRLSQENSALPQTPPPPDSGPALRSPTAATLCLCPRAGPVRHQPWAPVVPPSGASSRRDALASQVLCRALQDGKGVPDCPHGPLPTP